MACTVCWLLAASQCIAATVNNGCTALQPLPHDEADSSSVLVHWGRLLIPVHSASALSSAGLLSPMQMSSTVKSH